MPTRVTTDLQGNIRQNARGASVEKDSLLKKGRMKNGVVELFLPCVSCYLLQLLAHGRTQIRRSAACSIQSSQKLKPEEQHLDRRGCPTKKQKVRDGFTEGELPQDAAADAQPPQEQRAVGHPEAEVLNAVTAEDVCGNPLQPSPSWNKLTFATEQDAVHFGLCELEGEQADHMLLLKLVKFKPAVKQPESLCCCVYLRGHLYSQRTVSSPEEAQTVLDSTNSLALCGECGMKPDNEKRYVSYAGSYYSMKFTYASDLDQTCRPKVMPTVEFVKRMSGLISVMTSRCPRDALRPLSESVVELEAFLTYLDDWEEAAEKAGGDFISKSTVEGLRVTLRSTLSLLKYVTESLGFKYLLTSRLSQDKLENTFGIVRQYCGTNDHPSPGLFLVVVICLDFYNLARPPKHGNSPANLVNALLDAPSPTTSSAIFGIRDIVEDMLEVGDIDGASSAL
ncbi:hypothetical protein HPB51_001825 [Rhipicephalus microplus]|uniref:Transposable element P transposase-like RNase H C-terminal domain-containing protein n=1 Tax=Rhipicephalus microplus TaxID=6941 RepID=A0A9J6EEG9_RHIMP|nr:hypothetical protein HPB51_001825 [Rhipicephalus microplus]